VVQSVIPHRNAQAFRPNGIQSHSTWSELAYTRMCRVGLSAAATA
jgi:hypothetical protein